MFNPLLSKDTAIQIALKLEGNDLWNLWSTNKQLLGWICNNEQFWTQKIRQDFDINTYESLGGSGDSDDYRFLYIIQDKDIPTLNQLLISKSETGNIDHIRFLLNNGANIHALDYMALRFAAENGHKDVVELLLTCGANVHAWNDRVLISAAKNGHRDVVELLLKNGANPAFLD